MTKLNTTEFKYEITHAYIKKEQHILLTLSNFSKGFVNNQLEIYVKNPTMILDKQ